MNCEHFYQKMQDRLDDRLGLNGDQDLVQHASSCGNCRSKLDVWLSIESVIGSPRASVATPAPKASRFPAYALACVAASVLIALTIVPRQQDRGSESRAVVSLSSPASSFDPIQVDAALQAAQWWSEVRGDDWVAQTTPTVRSVREGFAPLGRSLMQVVTILMVGESGQAS